MNYAFEIADITNIADELFLKAGINYSTFNFHPSQLYDLRYTFIGIPILIRYELSKKRLNPYFEIGPSFQALIKAQLKRSTNPNSNTINISEDFKSLNVFGSAGIGISYELSVCTRIIGGINFNRQLNNFDKIYYTEKLYNYGLKFGLILSIK